jgi:hypothetical protein
VNRERISRIAHEALGDLADLPTTMDRVVTDGWTPVHGHISTRQDLTFFGPWPILTQRQAGSGEDHHDRMTLPHQ